MRIWYTFVKATSVAFSWYINGDYVFILGLVTIVGTLGTMANPQWHLCVMPVFSDFAFLSHKYGVSNVILDMYNNHGERTVIKP